VQQCKLFLPHSLTQSLFSYPVVSITKQHNLSFENSGGKQARNIKHWYQWSGSFRWCLCEGWRM